MLLWYNFGSEKLEGVPKKVELVRDVIYCFRKDWEGVVKRRGGGSVVTNEGVREAGE